MHLHVYVPSTRIAVSVPEYHNIASISVDSSISNHVITRQVSCSVIANHVQVPTSVCTI